MEEIPDTKVLRSGPLKVHPPKDKPKSRRGRKIASLIPIPTRMAGDKESDSKESEDRQKYLEAENARLKLELAHLGNKLKKLANANNSEHKLSVFESETEDEDDERENVNALIPTYIFDPLVSFPQYDSSKMTPAAFLIEVEEHLVWKKADKKTWLYMVTRMFKKDSDIARWWRETKPSVKSWSKFKAEFLKYEESGQSKDRLYSELYAKRQGLAEAFETFAWDVSGIYKKIDSTIQPNVIVERIVNSALPELSVILRSYTFNTVAELVFKAREVISDLNKVRAFERKTALRARASDPIASKPAHYADRPFQLNKNKHEYRHSRTFYGKPSTSKDNDTRVESEEQSSGLLASMSQEQQGSSKTVERETRSCLYCKKKGHLIKDCRKRLWKENLKQTANETLPKNQGN